MKIIIQEQLLKELWLKEIEERLKTETWVKDFPEEKRVIIKIPTNSNVIEFLIPRRNVYATNSHIF